MYCFAFDLHLSQNALFHPSVHVEYSTCSPPSHSVSVEADFADCKSSFANVFCKKFWLFLESVERKMKISGSICFENKVGSVLQ